MLVQRRAAVVTLWWAAGGGQVISYLVMVINGTHVNRRHCVSCLCWRLFLCFTLFSAWRCFMSLLRCGWIIKWWILYPFLINPFSAAGDSFNRFRPIRRSLPVGCSQSKLVSGDHVRKSTNPHPSFSYDGSHNRQLILLTSFGAHEKDFNLLNLIIVTRSR